MIEGLWPLRGRASTVGARRAEDRDGPLSLHQSLISRQRALLSVPARRASSTRPRRRRMPSAALGHPGAVHRDGRSPWSRCARLRRRPLGEYLHHALDDEVIVHFRAVRIFLILFEERPHVRANSRDGVRDLKRCQFDRLGLERHGVFSTGHVTPACRTAESDLPICIDSHCVGLGRGGGGPGSTNVAPDNPADFSISSSSNLALSLA